MFLGILMGILMEYSGLLWRKMKDNDEREGQRRGESKKEKVFFNAWIIYLTRIVHLDKNKREWGNYIIFWRVLI